MYLSVVCVVLDAVAYEIPFSLTFLSLAVTVK